MRVHFAASVLTVSMATAFALGNSGCSGSPAAPAADAGSGGAGVGSGGSTQGTDAAGGADAKDVASAPDVADAADMGGAPDVPSAADAKDAADAGGDAGGEVGATRCQELFAKCGLVDPGNGAIHGCVMTGMQGNAAACETSFASCKQTCGAALCTYLGTLCHDKDEPCHEMGHAGVAEPCFNRALECTELCK